MKKKVFSKLLMVALVATVGVFSSCKDYDDDISDVRNNLTQTATELRNDYNAKIETANKSIATLQTLYDGLDEAYKAADVQLNNLILTQTAAAVKEAKAYSDANLATAKDAAKAAEEAAKKAAKEYAEAEAAAAQAAAIAAAKEQVAAAQKELSDALAKANELIASQGESIANLVKAREELSAAVVAAQARADQAYALAEKAYTLAETNKANLEKAAADIAALQTGLANLQGTAANKADVAKLQSDLAALQKTVSENVVDLASYKESITSITSELAKLNSDLATAISNLNESIAAVKSTADGNVAAIDALKTQLTTIDAAWQLADKEIIKSITSLAAVVDANQAEAASTAAANKAEAAANLKAAVDAITAELAAKQTLIENNDAAIRVLLNTKVSELNKLIEGNAKDILAANKLITDNKAAQDAENVIMKNGIAKNALDIVSHGEKIDNLDKAIAALKKALGDDTAETLKAYAKSIAESNAIQAKLDAQGYADAQDAAQKLTLMQAIKDQAAQDAKAWTDAIDLAIENLVTTYKLAGLQKYIEQTAKAAQTAAEANAAVKAQEIANDALAKAKTYTDNLKQTLQDNYSTTDQMTKAIEAAQKAAISQAYLDVLNTLLRDYPEWYNLNAENKMNMELTPTILELTKATVEKYGLTKANAQDLINENLKAWLTKPEGTGTYDKDGNEIMSPAGEIMAEILAAADALDKEFTAKFETLDLRVADIEKILGVTVTADGDSTLAGEIFTASVNALIASATSDKFASLDKQLAGTEKSGLKDLIDAAAGQATQNAIDIKAISDAIANVNNKFAELNPKAVDSQVDANALSAFAANISDLIARVNKNSKVIDNLGNTVENYVNTFLAEKVGTMITAIHLFANQHMAERDQQYKVRYFDGEKYVYPFGFEDFDHELTFVYTIENGITKDLCTGDVDPANWNYPEELLSQIQGITSDRDKRMKADYDFSPVAKIITYDPTTGKVTEENSTTGFDFEDGRYRSQSDAILVRVSPTNADLKQAWKDNGIALLNSKGEDIIANGLVEIESVEKYQKNTYLTRPKDYADAQDYNGRYYSSRETRAADGNETGLWVISFKLVDQSEVNFEKYAYAAATAENPKQTEGEIVYAVAVKNTDFSYEEEDANGNTVTKDVDRYVVSEYDLSLGLEPAKHAWEFFVNSTSVDSIHNRYIQTDEALNGTTAWTDDPENYTGTFRYELTWHPFVCDGENQPATPGTTTDETVDPVKQVWYEYCWNCCFTDRGQHLKCDDGIERAGFDFNEIAYTKIEFNKDKDIDRLNTGSQKGINTCDRHGHNFTTAGKRSHANDLGDDDLSGIDNRHALPKKLITFSADQAPEGENGEWAKIEIDFNENDDCGNWTPIRGFFVTLDNHFALESGNSEVNAWATYTYKNVALYNYDQNVKRTTPGTGPAGAVIDEPITLQKGNHGVIYLKNENNVNNGEIIGFRVHAVNLDGTFTDPDGRAFYVEIGKEKKAHKLTFDVLADTIESYAVQNLTKNGKEVLYDEKDQIDNVNGQNPIETYNDNMRSELSSDRFFNRDAYKASFEDAEKYRVVYTWRADNPAIRGYLKNSTGAYVPVEGTGYTYGVKNSYGTNGAVIKDLSTGSIKTNYGGMVEVSGGLVPTEDSYNVEQFFDFWYSTDADADVKGTAEKPWAKFNTPDEDGIAAPCMKTNSMRVSIKAGVANRLIDGGIYKIKMSIQRKDAQTVWTTINTYDIDIKKVMPTAMPEQFAVKSNQLTDGKWNFNLRPYAGLDFTQGGAIDPWKITWDKFVINPVDNATFAGLFNADKYTDKNKNEQASNLHNYRWGMDVRMYNFEGIFEGLYIDELDADGNKTGNKLIDKNYYFLFAGAGSFAGAEEAISKSTAAEKADADNASKDAIAVYDENYSNSVNPGNDDDALTHQKGAYTLPLIHWSHLGEQNKAVKAGYIYRNISANLDETGKKFLDPTAEKAGMYGLKVKNADHEIDPVVVKLKNGTAVVASYRCALFDNGVTFTSKTDGNASAGCTFDYNQDIAVKSDTAATFKLSETKWQYDNDDKWYFNTGFQTDWTTTKAGTLANWIATPWCWVDVTSLKFTATAPTGFEYLNYYDEPYFTVAGAEFDPKDNDYQDIDGIAMDRSARNEGLNAFAEDVKGYFSYDIYDIWFHKKTVNILIKVNKKPNGTSRQARK